MKLSFLLITLALTSCSYKTDIPLEFPTPPPPAAATPLPKIELRPDAELERQFAEIAKEAKGKVGVAAVVLETGESAMLNADGHYPMQSAYKLPISMAVMEQVRLGRLSLDEHIGVTPDDFVRQGQASPLRDKNPNGGEFTIRELIRLALVESDGTASDVLLRIAGGPDEVQSYLTQIGIQDMKIVNTEKEFGSDWDAQYQNLSTPSAAIELLRYLEATGGNATVTERAPTQPEGTLPNGRVSARNSVNSVSSVVNPDKTATTENTESTDENLILRFMIDSVTGPNRLKGLLPKGTTVAHKTGTGGARDGITSATNDTGIIYLPNGKHLAIAVFVSDSPVDERTRESVIARIAKASWNRWSK